jgi:flavin-dependent dehydrogenase
MNTRYEKEQRFKFSNMTESTLTTITDKSTIVIIGGGPSGASCAIKLKKLSQDKGLNPRIVVYEGKRFEKKSYYNQCIGVLSPPIEHILENALGIPFPWDIINKKINGYFIHTGKYSLKLEGEHEPSYSCRRVEFDNYLFQKVKELNIETIQARVTDLDFDRDGVMVYSESNNIRADIVVGAFGLDDGMAKVFERCTSYRQPKFLSSIVTKIHPGEQEMQKFGNYIHAFLPKSLPYVEFGAITPKENHLSINIAGKTVDSAMMDAFLEIPCVRKSLPQNFEQMQSQIYYFKGKFPTLPAKGIFGDRYVMVGDTAGLIRPLKGKGINSAVVTGINAAEVIINHGISKEGFDAYMNSCSDLTCDIPYGKTLRFLSNKSSKYGFLDSVLVSAENEPKLKKALFNIVSGQQTYKNIWAETKSFKLVFKLGFRVLKDKISKPDRRLEC